MFVVKVDNESNQPRQYDVDVRQGLLKADFDAVRNKVICIVQKSGGKLVSDFLEKAQYLSIIVTPDVATDIRAVENVISVHEKPKHVLMKGGI